MSPGQIAWLVALEAARKAAAVKHKQVQLYCQCRACVGPERK